MENIKSARELKKAIRELEADRLRRENRLHEQWEEVVESFRPANILKRSFQDIFPASRSKTDLLGSVVAVATGILSRKLFAGKAPGPIRKTAATALQLGVTSLVAKNADKLKSKGTSLFKRIFSRKK